MDNKIFFANPTINDILSIKNIAYSTWNATYKNIISQQQIDYMLQLFYNETLLQEQLSNPNHFFIVAKKNIEVFGYSHCYLENEQTYKLSKLYILPNWQGKNIGKQLIQLCEETIQSKGISQFTLNVNRANPAVAFYLKNGFKIVEEVDIPLNKFWLNDYVMRKII